MATTNETMRVITGGLDETKEPEVFVDGKVIAVEIPDEMAEALEGIIRKASDQIGGLLYCEKGNSKEEYGIIRCQNSYYSEKAH